MSKLDTQETLTNFTRLMDEKLKLIKRKYKKNLSKKYLSKLKTKYENGLKIKKN